MFWRFLNEPVDVICVSPAPVRVCVSVSSVDEGVFERSADVLRRQTGHRRHHVTGKLADAQGASVLTAPPVMLGPERTPSLHLKSTWSCWHARDSSRQSGNHLTLTI